MVTEGADERRAVLAQLLGVRRAHVGEQGGEEGGVAPLRPPVQHPGQGQVGVETAQEAVDATAARVRGQGSFTGRARWSWYCTFTVTAACILRSWHIVSVTKNISYL